MGLDMYLNKDLYLSEYTGSADEMNKIYDIVGMENMSGTFKHVIVEFPAIYWRKANAIHQWFVNNVQGGVDDCGKYVVTADELQVLLDVVTEQIKDKHKDILLPQAGFFFGSTDKDEWYWDDLKRTKKDLKREIKFVKDEAKKKRFWDYHYQASW